MNNNDDFLVEKQDSDVVWLGIYEGMLCQKRAHPVDGFKEYVSTNDRSRGKIVYIKHYKKINGILTGIERRDKETKDGKPYPVAQFSFQKGDRKAIIEVGAKTEFVSRFAKCCENMDLTKPVEVSVFLSREGKTAVAFNQNDQKIVPNYTADNRNGLPEWIKDDISGDWDTREYWKFLYNVLQNVAIPAAAQNKANFEMSIADEPEVFEEEFATFSEDEFATLEQHPPVPQQAASLPPSQPVPVAAAPSPMEQAPAYGLAKILSGKVEVHDDYYKSGVFTIWKEPDQSIHCDCGQPAEPGKNGSFNCVHIFAVALYIKANAGVLRP